MESFSILCTTNLFHTQLADGLSSGSQLLLFAVLRLQVLRIDRKVQRRFASFEALDRLLCIVNSKIPRQ